MTSGLETKTTCQQIVKVTLMVTASLAAAVVCSFDCLWVSKMVLGKQINTLTQTSRAPRQCQLANVLCQFLPGFVKGGDGMFWGM